MATKLTCVQICKYCQ